MPVDQRTQLGIFAMTGLRTEIGLLSGVTAWLACGVIVLVASVGKLGGAAIAARVTGFGWREALGLGVLMNTRGLMQLIVLSVGLDLGVLSPALFAMFVIMALVTTLMTAPILGRIGGSTDRFTPNHPSVDPSIRLSVYPSIVSSLPKTALRP